MTWQTHAAGGIAALWLLAPVPNVLTGTNTGILAVTAALGALLPDLDIASSKASSLSVYGIQPVKPLSLQLNSILGHRGLLHSLPGLILFILVISGPLAFWWGFWPSLALVLGYASHLVLDACTVRGVPLLPAKEQHGNWSLARKWHLLPHNLRIVTSSDTEGLVFALVAAAALFLLLHTLLQVK